MAARSGEWAQLFSNASCSINLFSGTPYDDCSDEFCVYHSRLVCSEKKSSLFRETLKMLLDYLGCMSISITDSEFRVYKLQHQLCLTVL